jgi:hypothetical protein
MLLLFDNFLQNFFFGLVTTPSPRTQGADVGDRRREWNAVMPIETRVFFAVRGLSAPTELPSLALPEVMQHMLQLGSAAAAQAAASALASDEPEVRVDEYMALPPPLGFAIGIKARGGKRKVEAKVIVPPPLAAGAQGRASALDDWEKHSTKISRDGEWAQGVAAWLRADVHHPAAAWAAQQIAAGCSIPVSVMKTRQGCSLRDHNAYVEQTDVAVSLLGGLPTPNETAAQVVVFRSWAVESSSSSAFLTGVSAKWAERLRSLLGDAAGSAEVLVDGYPGFVHTVATRHLLSSS